MDLTLPQSAFAAALDVLTYATSDCSLGRVSLARSPKGVCAILMDDDRADLLAELSARFPEGTLVEDDAVVQEDIAKIHRFLEKPADGLHLTLDMRGTPFQRRVWEKIRTIPVGRTVTYSELARWISPLASPRAVASACAANPIALGIPCHRVVASNGDLAGYRWGFERKRALIRLEATA